MAAYILIDRLSVTDPDALEEYQSIASATVRRHAGRFVLPDPMKIEALEGNWRPDRVVLIEFEDLEHARQWWNSSEYAQARALHHGATISNVILVEGAPP
jgi:uncharacterized protein (DUF1330 family)